MRVDRQPWLRVTVAATRSSISAVSSCPEVEDSADSASAIAALALKAAGGSSHWLAHTQKLAPPCEIVQT